MEYIYCFGRNAFANYKSADIAVTISDTVDFLHQYITAPTVTPADRILHSINTLTGAIKETPIAVYDAQLKAIKALQDACHRWHPQERQKTTLI